MLINEFGQIGLDAALLGPDTDGVTMAEIPGGCLCCVNGLPFQVGLARLLRKARPDRLLIEPSGLGHPAELLRQLRQPPWQRVLAVQPSVLVLDAAALHRGEALPDSQRQALPDAGLLLLNKSGARRSKPPGAGPPATGAPAVLDDPGPAANRSTAASVHAPANPATDQPAEWGACAERVWLDTSKAICRTGDAKRLEHRLALAPEPATDLDRIAQWLAQWPWQRAKLVIHGGNGWQSANAVAGQTLAFRPSEWRRDSRLELIFSEPQDQLELERGLQACRIAD